MIASSSKTAFIELLHPELRGQIEVRIVNKQGEAVLNPYFPSIEEFNDYLFPNDLHVYVSMYSRKKYQGDKEHSVYTKVIWADYDKMTLEEVKWRIEYAGLPTPSIFVSSGYGIHCYWLLTQKTTSNVEDILKAIANRTGGDVNVAEKARTMRLPGTFNVKGEDPKLCEIIEQNGNCYQLESFRDTLSLAGSETTEVDELLASKMACIRLVAKGVSKGQRNFALGKITAFLKQQGHSKKKSFGIVKQWNRNNAPVKPPGELQDEFNRFWEGDYKYLGCKFTNPDLERINKQLCPIGECQFHATQSIQVTNAEDTTVLDNELFKTTVYPKIRGLAIAIYSTIATAKSITRDHLAELVHRHIKDRVFIKSIHYLQSFGYIQIEEGNKRNGIPDKLILVNKSNYGRGFTVVNLLLTKLYLSKQLNENSYKLLILLKSYAYGKKEVYPTVETLATKLGIEERSVTRILENLEHHLYIKRKYLPLDNGKIKLFIELQF